MSNLLMISLGLMLLVGWAFSISIVLGYSKFETEVIRYTQAIALLPIIAGMACLLVLAASHLYQSMLSWLVLDSVTITVAIGLIILSTLISLPLFILVYFVWQNLLKILDLRFYSDQ